MGAHLVAVQHLGVPPQGGQLLLEPVGQGGFARAGETGQPDHEATAHDATSRGSCAGCTSAFVTMVFTSMQWIPQASLKASDQTARSTVSLVTRSGTRAARRLPANTPGIEPASRLAVRGRSTLPCAR